VDLDSLLVARREAGICRVLCFSPRHDLTISGMEVADLRRVVGAWAQQWEELGERSFIHYVQIFENRGAMMGASTPILTDKFGPAAVFRTSRPKSRQPSDAILIHMVAVCSASIYRQKTQPEKDWFARTNISQPSCRSGRFGRLKPSSFRLVMRPACRS
jgi:hypothetical protein